MEGFSAFGAVKASALFGSEQCRIVIDLFTEMNRSNFNFHDV